MRPVVLIHELPFEASGKACTAAATQARGFDNFGDIIWLHFSNRIFKGVKAPVLAVDHQIIHLFDLAMAQQDVFAHLPTSSRQLSTRFKVLSTV